MAVTRYLTKATEDSFGSYFQAAHYDGEGMAAGTAGHNAGHIAATLLATSRKQRAMNADTQLSVSFI